MALIVIFDEVTTPQKVVNIIIGAHTPDFSSRTDVAINPDLSALATFDAEGRLATFIVPRRYWKHSTGAIVEYTQAEKDAQDAQDAIDREAERVQGIANTKLAAKDQIIGFADTSLFLRAFISILIEEINTLRALHSLPDRTIAQLKTAIGNRIDDGTIDL